MVRPSRLSYKRRFKNGQIKALWMYLLLKETCRDANEAETETELHRNVVAELNWRAHAYMCRGCYRAMTQVIERALRN